jgi:hypothetical protein
MAKEDKTIRKLRRDIADLDSSITDMDLDLVREKDKNSRNARSLKAQIASDRKKLKKLEDMLRDLT